jgi:hypothetical protein
MTQRNRCPDCGRPVSPFAAGCAICGADLDAHRRRIGETPSRPSFRTGIPVTYGDTTDLVIATVVMGLLAVFAPLYGALLSALVIWQSERTGNTARRNVAIFCAALAVFDLLDPSVLVPTF